MRLMFIVQTLPRTPVVLSRIHLAVLTAIASTVLRRHKSLRLKRNKMKKGLVGADEH